jgi:hypothetical protein
MSYWVRRLRRRFNKRVLPSQHYCVDCGHHVEANHNEIPITIARAKKGQLPFHEIRSFGRLKPDKRAKERIAQVPSIRRLLKAVKLPAKYAAPVPPVRDQGNEGSCTGHGAYGMKGSQETLSETYQDSPAPRFAYNNARYRGGLLGQEGAYMIDVLDGLLEDGMCREQYMPYVAEGADKDDWPPKNPDAVVDAKNWRVKNFYDCMKDPDGSPAKDPVANLKQAIYQFGAVDMGTPWTQSWMDNWLSGNMPIPPDNDALLGGHSWVTYGWDDSTSRFKARNSWGVANAMKGDFTYPYATLTCKNWKQNDGCEAYKAEDDTSILCPVGQHYDMELQQCVDDGASPNPPNCEENYQACVMDAMQETNVWNMIIKVVTCVVNYYMCALGYEYKVTSKRSLTAKKKKQITITVKEV